MSGTLIRRAQDFALAQSHSSPERVLDYIMHEYKTNPIVGPAIAVRYNAIASGGLHASLDGEPINDDEMPVELQLVYDQLRRRWRTVVADMWRSIMLVGYAAVVVRTTEYVGLDIELTEPFVVPWHLYRVLDKFEYIREFGKEAWTDDIANDEYRAVFFSDEHKRFWCDDAAMRPFVFCVNAPRDGCPDTPVRYMYDMHKYFDIHLHCSALVATRAANPEAFLLEHTSAAARVAGLNTAAVLDDRRAIDPLLRADMEETEREIELHREIMARAARMRTEEEMRYSSAITDRINRQMTFPKPESSRYGLHGDHEVSSDTTVYPLGRDKNLTWVPTPTTIPGLTDLLEQIREEFCRLMKVPPALLGMEAHGQRSMAREALVGDRTWDTQVREDLDTINGFVRVICDVLVYSDRYTVGGRELGADMPRLQFHLGDTRTLAQVMELLPLLTPRAARSMLATSTNLPPTFFRPDPQAALNEVELARKRPAGEQPVASARKRRKRNDE
jgi:hypothetical protein